MEVTLEATKLIVASGLVRVQVDVEALKVDILR